MSRDNTEYDVRVALYDGTKTPLANIVFFNDCELLLECERVLIRRDGNRLYFTKGDKTAGSVKLSTKSKDRLQLWKDYSKVRDLEGRYDLKYDNLCDTYYIDKSEILSDDDISRRGTIKGVKHLNHNPGNREKGTQMTVAIPKTKTPQLTEKGKSTVANAEKQSTQEAQQVVVKALLALLKTQVKGNKDALSTISALENYI